MSNDQILRPAQDRTYFMRRAAQERSAADRASGAQARKAHETLAKRYTALVHDADQKSRQPVA